MQYGTIKMHRWQTQNGKKVNVWRNLHYKAEVVIAIQDGTYPPSLTIADTKRLIQDLQDLVAEQE